MITARQSYENCLRTSNSDPFKIKDINRIRNILTMYVYAGKYPDEQEENRLVNTYTGANYILCLLNRDEDKAICEGEICDRCAFKPLSGIKCSINVAKYLLSLMSSYRTRVSIDDLL